MTSRGCVRSSQRRPELRPFHPGDDPRWVDPAFDDSKWPLISAEKGWSEQGYKNMSGTAWYRAKVLAQLCIFGQQFEPACTDLVNYLALPQPPQREQALLLLVRAFLGLRAPDSAEPQIDSLLHGYPYYFSIHLAIDQVIDEAEGSLFIPSFNDIALQLCQTQTAATLPVLRGGKTLEGKESTVSAATLFIDAVRCAALARSTGRSDYLNELASVAHQSSWAGTADLAFTQQARATSGGEPVTVQITIQLREGSTSLERLIGEISALFL